MRASAAGVPPALRLTRPANRAAALGSAVAYLMTKPAFAGLRFGDWSRILVGQVNRGHFCFATRDGHRVEGFMGWALTTRDKAEAWAAGRGLSSEDSRAGGHVVFNAWAADTSAVHRFMFDEVRKMMQAKERIYYIRHYPNGTTRRVSFPVNRFVVGHIDRPARGGA